MSAASSLHPGQLQALADIVGDQYVRVDAFSLEQYGGDQSQMAPTCAGAVVLPGDVAQVQAIVRFAIEQGVALVPSGGRTGLSGGAVAQRGELVVALDRLNAISDYSAVDRTVRCGAGVVTAQLQDFAESHGLSYPVDFASAGSSQLGGNIATNAGGIKVLRYGMTRDWVAGLTVVTGNGERLDLDRALVKDNAGYDLRQLFIGAEGTLGIIVEATLRLAPLPSARAVLVLGAPDMVAVLQVLKVFRGARGLAAFEFFSELALQKVVEGQGLQRPFATSSPFYALIELELEADAALSEAQVLFERCLSQGWVEDGVLSQSESQAKALWRLREDISTSLAAFSPYKNDISTLTSHLPQFLADVEAEVKTHYPDYDVVWFGHIGDGNVHLNILKPAAVSDETFKAHCALVTPRIFAIVQRYGGSIAAEHGVGLLKKQYLSFSRTPAEIAFMRQIKQVFDPAGIMNPGKIFD